MAKRKPARPGNARPGNARPSRSKKAGSPPSAVNSSPRVRRRRKRAHAALSKGTTLFATDHGPRAAWPASASKRKKR